MKKLAFALGTAAFALTLASCSGSEEKKEQASGQEAPKTAKAEGEKFAPTTNIRY